MTREQRLKFAKVLISLAIVLILAGIGIELESKSLLDPVTDTHVVANSNDSNISITTIDTFEDDQAPNDTTETETENETASESGTNEGSSPAPGNNTKTPSQGNNIFDLLLYHHQIICVLFQEQLNIFLLEKG